MAKNESVIWLKINPWKKFISKLNQNKNFMHMYMYKKIFTYSL